MISFVTVALFIYTRVDEAARVERNESTLKKPTSTLPGQFENHVYDVLQKLQK